VRDTITLADSTKSLIFDIIGNTSSEIIEEACDSYTSPSGNYIYTSSGIYSDTLPNRWNCDSIITIDLSINYSNSGTDIITACQSYTWIDGITYTESNNTATWTLTNIVGCDSIVTLDLTINNIETGVSQNNTNLNALAEGAIYQWLDCDNDMSPIEGETGQSFTATVSGNYAVEVIQFDCTDTSICYPVTVTGIIENNFDTEFKFFPNPTKGSVTIESKKYYPEIKLIITDINGAIIFETTFHDERRFELMLNEPAGIYFIRIISNDNKALLRLIKE